MKRFYVFGAAAMTLMMAACDPVEEPAGPDNPTELAAPVLQLGEVTETTASISWEAVENARSYAYYIADTDDTVSTDLTEILLEGLEPATGYVVRVKA